MVRHLKPTESQWTTTDHLLAGVLDALNGANYQRGGGRGSKPKPVPRPGDGGSPQAAQKTSGSQMFAGDGFEPDSVSLSEIDDWLGMTPVAA